ncbi:Mu-like prophage major head subunit gpT [Nitrosospira sp. Nsp2]|uniref:Mu-like prophage major head subunit gpT family protein n=1 Tax=Nitrosospira sp. Nsp2 TaxID=136548 RepID=UPI000D2FBD82|nr:Mu-like prophage major head subunit gpT family protein [Nitrosospira sp. Nsp2]PTR17496.1 Mu-like prophage major head subunit gpT [Nitrosospira sp. Nsp2]
MDQQILSSRAIVGMYYARLETNPGLAWVDGVSNLFDSDQASETYAFLGQSPAMREWVGGRQAKGLSGGSLILTNRHYEATLEIAVRDARRDKTSQIAARVQEFADRAETHWASLLSTLLLNGASSLCYDGQYYFDTDHSEGDSGTQSNSISVDISTLPAAVHGAVTAPSVEEMQQAILAAIAQILSFKDNRGEPMNENAKSFSVIVPVGLFLTASAAVSAITTGALQQNLNPNLIAGLKIEVHMNPRLTWTDSFAVFRTDSPIKGLIRQSETGIELKVKGENSEYEFDNQAWQFGIDTWRTAGYGYWQRACKVTMT